MPRGASIGLSGCPCGGRLTAAGVTREPARARMHRESVAGNRDPASVADERMSRPTPFGDDPHFPPIGRTRKLVVDRARPEEALQRPASLPAVRGAAPPFSGTPWIAAKMPRPKPPRYFDSVKLPVV